MSSMYGNSGRRPQQMPTQEAAGYDVGQIQQYTPEQMELFNQMFSHVGPESYLSKLAGGDEATFNQMEAPAMRQFNALQGNMASRFSGAGTGGRHSSGFQNTMTAGASNFAQDIASRRQSLQQQAIKDLMSMSSDILGQHPYEQYITEPKKTFGQQILGAGLPIAGAAIGGHFGGYEGANLGYKIGNSAGQAFA